MLPAVQRQTSKTPMPDLVLFAAMLALLVIGVVTVFSASYTTGLRDYGDPYFYIKRQLLWAALGIALLLITMRIDYRLYRKYAWFGLLIALALLGLVLVAGTEVSGSQRWISIGGFRFQPSEFAKVALVNFLAAYIAMQGGNIRRFFSGFVVPMAIVGLVAGLVILEKDFGTAATIGLNGLIMLFAAGATGWHLWTVAAAMVPAAVVLVRLEPYRIKRITSFVNPWADPLGSGWNIIQSLFAVGSGGLFGLGLGAGRQKFAYLPEQHTDFIFAVLSEELGFLGSAFVVSLFFVVAWRGLRIALQVSDVYGTMLAVGLTGMIVVQALVNMGVVTGSLPVTGITLPFISSGGTSLLVTLGAMGVLLNISQYTAGGQQT